MKLLLTCIFLTTASLSADNLVSMSATNERDHFPYKPTPSMGSCPFTMLIGGFEQKCYGYGIYDGSGPSGTWYHCSLHPEHRWISKSGF